jgi:myosin heavy subunit
MKTITMTINEFIKKVKVVEGFDVEVWNQKVQAAGNSRVKVKLSTRRSPNGWTTSQWIEKRVSQESSSSFAFSVRWGNRKSKPQSGTDLKTIRESYPASFGLDARNAAQVKKEMEKSIGELQIEFEKLQGKVTRERKEHARLKAENTKLETASIDLARQLKREKKEHARLKAKNENLETASIDLARKLEERDKQLEEKTKLAAMTASQIDKKATNEGKMRAKDEDRVGDGVTPVALSHHRTCGSAYGGSLSMLEASLGVQQRNQPELVKEALRIGRVHVTCAGVPPWTTSVARRFPCPRCVQSALL